MRFCGLNCAAVVVRWLFFFILFSIIFHHTSFSQCGVWQCGSDTAVLFPESRGCGSAVKFFFFLLLMHFFHSTVFGFVAASVWYVFQNCVVVVVRWDFVYLFIYYLLCCFTVRCFCSHFFIFLQYFFHNTFFFYSTFTVRRLKVLFTARFFLFIFFHGAFHSLFSSYSTVQCLVA